MSAHAASGGWELEHRYGPRVHVLDNVYLQTALARIGNPNVAHRDLMALLSGLVEERGVDLVALSDVEETLALAATPLRMPKGVPEWLGPITGIVPA